MPASSPSVRHDRRIAVLAGDQPWAQQVAQAIVRAGGQQPLLEEPAPGAGVAREVEIALIAIDGEGSLALLRDLRKLPGRPALVAIVREGDPQLELAMEAGADDCLVVPVGTSELLTRLDIVANRRRLAAEQGMLRRIAVSVAAGFDHPTLYDQVARELAQLLRADGGRVVEFTDPEQAMLLGAWRRSDFEPIQPGTLLRLAPTWALAQVQRTGGAARSELAAADAAAARAPLRASLAAPVNVGGAVWGAVAVAYEEPTRAHEEALVQLERVADLVSLAVANAEAARRLSQMARTDPLTGLVNHRVFHERLTEEVARSSRTPAPLSLAVIDLDHFKAINDDHGHSVGDDALRMVARVLGGHARRIDTVGRVGGEELAWLMPGAALAGAREAAERARGAIAAGHVPAAGSLTASIGVAQLEDGMGAPAFFDAADAAMYEAKRSGRDCVRP